MRHHKEVWKWKFKLIFFSSSGIGAGKVKKISQFLIEQIYIHPKTWKHLETEIIRNHFILMISLSKLNDSVTDTLLLLRYFANSYGDSEILCHQNYCSGMIVMGISWLWYNITRKKVGWTKSQEKRLKLFLQAK